MDVLLSCLFPSQTNFEGNNKPRVKSKVGVQGCEVNYGASICGSTVKCFTCYFVIAFVLSSFAFRVLTMMMSGQVIEDAN